MAEAIANGSAVAGKTVMAVLVNYIAFLGLLGFINSTLSWLGGRVGFSELSFGVRFLSEKGSIGVLFLNCKEMFHLNAGGNGKNILKERFLT